jgi:hypothetical protein
MLPLLNSERVIAQTAGVPKRFISMVWGSGIVPTSFYAPVGPLGATLPAILAPFKTAPTPSGQPIDLTAKLLQIRGKSLGGIDAPAYNAMMADIERRVARLPLYR